MLEIAPSDFYVQMQTLRGVGGRDAADRLRATGKFGTLLQPRAVRHLRRRAGALGPLRRVQPAQEARPARAASRRCISFATADGKVLRLTRYKGGNKGPLILTHGLGVSSLIFPIDTIDTNLLEYLVAAEYDCWLLDYRASVDLPYARELWTADDVAPKDYPAAVAKVRGITRSATVQVIAHCFGATTFTMAMLAGLEGVRSAVISQISTDYVVPWFPQRLLAYLRAPPLFDAMGIDVVNARATTADSLRERVLDKLLQMIVPVPRAERTHEATSNRIIALYGRLYNLEQLNNATFTSGLAEMFGEANIDAFKQLALFARSGRLARRRRARRLPAARRAHGAARSCSCTAPRTPASSRRARRARSSVWAQANGRQLYERHVIPGYGHIDCIFGKNAAHDVYPLIVAHLDKTANV